MNDGNIKVRWDGENKFSVLQPEKIIGKYPYRSPYFFTHGIYPGPAPAHNPLPEFIMSLKGSKGGNDNDDSFNCRGEMI